MSEEASSPSSSESLPSSKSFQMKRQNNVEVSNVQTLDDTKDNNYEKTDCKRRRKSCQNNNPELNVPKIEDDNSETLGEESIEDCYNQASLLSINLGSSDGTGTSSITFASTTIEELEIDAMADVLQNPTDANAVDNKVTISTSMERSITDNAANNDGGGDNLDAAANPTVAEENAVNETTAARNSNIRHRQYRRSARLSMSSTTSDTPMQVATNDSGTAEASRGLIDSDDDSSSDDVFQFPYMEESSDSYDENDIIDDSIMPSDDDDDESNEGADINSVFENILQRRNRVLDSERHQAQVEEVLEKPLPISKWNTMAEVLYREHGLSNRFSTSPWCQNRFNQRFYASTFVVEHIKFLHGLRKHKGCVNSLNFNRNGNLLCSGSDDRRIVIWDWAHKKVKHAYSSGHKENIFQTKFITSGTGIDIVSAGRDGQVRRSVIPTHGKETNSCLYRHNSAVHKLVICPASPYEIISVGEDGYINHSDLRKEPNSNTLTKVFAKDSQNRIGLFSIAHHPYAPEIVVCGVDEYVRVYDKRKFDKPVHMMCPAQSTADNITFCQVTCCTYNHNGTEILATYSDEQIYLFDNKNYTEGSHLHSYRGHYNHRTIKGVNFFGPNSEYVISGSDCGNIFFWDKETEAILNFMPGDAVGVVNCLEPHPTIPVLATSGLDYSVKIWAPGSKNTVPDKEKLKRCISRNMSRAGSKGRSHYLDRALSHILLQSFQPDADHDGSSDSSNVEFELNSMSSSHGDNSDESDEEPRALMLDTDDSDESGPHLEGFSCRTQ